MADDMKALPAVYQAIAAVMQDVGREGIAKGRRNEMQKYNFRGIDDVYNALAPILARHHLIIVPRVLTRDKTEQASKNGGVLFYVVVHVEFDIICSVDGSRITAATYGEAMDSADKATNKAMSAAYKYMAMQTFCIPTEGDNDADAHHHEVRRNAVLSGAGQRETPKSQQKTGAASREIAAPVDELDGEEVDQTTQPEWPILEAEMEDHSTREELKAWWNTPDKKALKSRKPHLARAFYRIAFQKRWEELGETVEWTDEAEARG